jgi:CelD/BcsL family acetyltransferase involved in cellulose biosynthesis
MTTAPARTGSDPIGAPRPDLTVHVERSATALAALAGPWDELWDQTPDATVYQSRRWALAALRHLAGADRLHLVTVTAGRRLVALAPLVRMRLGLGPASYEYYVPLGQEQADYGGFLLGPQPDRTALVILNHLDGLLRRPNRVLVLPRLVVGDPTHVAVTSFGWSPGIQITPEQATTCSFLDLTAYDDPAAEVQRRARRRSVPRLARRLGDTGEVSYTYHDPSVAAMDRMFEVHARRWESKVEPMQGLFSTPRLRDFSRALVTDLDEVGQVRVSTLSCSDRPVAVCLGYVARGRYHYHKPAFDPEFARFKPGHLLITRLMESALAEGVTEFDFGRGAGQYKDLWSDGSRQAVSLSLRRDHALAPAQHLLRRAAGSYRVRRLGWSRDPLQGWVRSRRPRGADQANRS